MADNLKLPNSASKITPKEVMLTVVVDNESILVDNTPVAKTADVMVQEDLRVVSMSELLETKRKEEKEAAMRRGEDASETGKVQQFATKVELEEEAFEIQDKEEEFEFVSAEIPAEKKSFLLYEEEEKVIEKEETVKAVLPKEEPASSNLYGNDYYEQIKQKAIQRAHERFEKLKGLRSNNQNPEEFKEKLETPAYVRKQVKLSDVQHSSERNISRFNLTDENEFLKNNRFLHDNVD
jgi:hypothetical protein